MKANCKSNFSNGSHAIKDRGRQYLSCSTNTSRAARSPDDMTVRFAPGQLHPLSGSLKRPGILFPVPVEAPLKSLIRGDRTIHRLLSPFPAHDAPVSGPMGGGHGERRHTAVLGSRQLMQCLQIGQNHRTRTVRTPGGFIWIALFAAE